jgi:hypothetical protein
VTGTRTAAELLTSLTCTINGLNVLPSCADCNVPGRNRQACGGCHCCHYYHPRSR